MATGSPLRFYANPLKLALLFVGSLTFVIIGYFMVRTGNSLGWLAIIFFGLCILVSMAMSLRYTLFRQPLLEIDAQGWNCRANLFGAAQHVNWHDIAYIAIYRQQVPRGGSQYHLLLQARYPERLSHQRLRAFSASFYPVMRDAAANIPLNQLFLGTTPEKCQHLLDRIVAVYEQELRYYGIQVYRKIGSL